MTLHPNSDVGNEKTRGGNNRSHDLEPASFNWKTIPVKKKGSYLWLLVGIFGLAILAASVWLWPDIQPDTPHFSEKQSGNMVNEKLSAASDAYPDLRPSSENDKVASSPPALATSPEEDTVVMQSEENPSVEEFVATAEQELYYQKTRMFMEEARESLPLIGIRAYNPIAAAKRAYQASIAGNASDTSETSEESEASDDEQEVLLDDRGLKDGEIWIRINAANSGEHLEIMAQTADLYRSNTGFDGEVTVMVWVGGQPWIRETFE